MLLNKFHPLDPKAIRSAGALWITKSPELSRHPRLSLFVLVAYFHFLDLDQLLRGTVALSCGRTDSTLRGAQTMTQAYSDPTRADDPYSLPDMEVFYAEEGDVILDDGTAAGAGWYWWTCFPGCMPDSDPYGPFETEADALADAQDWE
jgi:hypothetical protein